MKTLLKTYQSLLAENDAWFSRQQERLGSRLACAPGCCGCCRGLFDITLLDAALLQQGARQLAAAEEGTLRAAATERIVALQTDLPEFAAPYILNLLPDEVWVDFPEEDLTPCLFLDPDGRCRIYPFRPLTCRLHGLPQIDLDGDVFLDSHCTQHDAAELNADPLLRRDLKSLYQREFALQQAFAANLCGVPLTELDTLIPAALLIDFETFDWATWRQQNLPLLTRFR